MINKEWRLVILATFTLIVAFFSRAIFLREVPFPGDLLVAEYKPWRTYSYEDFTPGAVPNKAQFPDTLRQLYPWKTAMLEALKAGTLPLWNPYNFAGTPLLANVQSAVFYPLNILYFLFSQPDAWTILVILQPLLGFVFMYAYARKVSLTPPASAFAAISYAFSSFMVVWLEYNTVGHVILWLPAILLSIEHLRERISAAWLTLYIFSYISALFAGHIQVFGYLLVISVAYIFFRVHTKHFRRLLLVTTVLVLTAGAVQLVPAGELIYHASRSPHEYGDFVGKILIQPWQLVMLVVRDFFGNPATRNYWLGDTYVGKVTSIGLLPLIFIPLAFSFRKQGLVHFFSVASVTVILFVTANPLTKIIFRMNLPIVNASSPTLSVFIFTFAISMLAGFGFDIWMGQKQRKPVGLHAFPLLFALALLWLTIAVLTAVSPQGAFTVHSVTAVRNLGLTSALFALYVLLLIAGYRFKPKLIVLLLLLAVHSFELWFNFTKFTPFAPPGFVFPQAPILTFLQERAQTDRFWGHGSAAVDANFATQVTLYSPEGYDPLYPKRYGEFISLSENGKISPTFTRQTRSDANVAPSSYDTLQENPYRMKVLSALGVRFILDRDENGSTIRSFPTDLYSPIYRSDGWIVYEYRGAAPRVSFVSQYDLYRTKEEFAKLFFREYFDPKQSVLLEQQPQFEPDGNGDARMKIDSYTPNEVVITAVTDGNRILVLSDTYYPGWQAYVDDQPVKIQTANFAFRAVSVPKGTHTIRFLYQPRSFTIGVYTSVISFGLLMILILMALNGYRKHTTHG